MSLSIVLVDPEIPGNTGAIGRLCAGINANLIIVGNPKFEITEKAAQRAGLDYWPFLSLKKYENFEEYLENENPKDFFLFSKRAKKNFFDAVFTKETHLIFGCESEGLPIPLQKKYSNHCLSIPILNENVRSLNLANAVSVVSYAALYQFHRFEMATQI